MKGVHDSPFSGHLGATRTLERIGTSFFWPRMRKSVEEYVAACQVCAQCKLHDTSGKAPMQSIEMGQPFTFWAMDYRGPQLDTVIGNKHILVIMDHFSKWCEAFVTKDQKASTVADALVSKVFSRFGPPALLHSDQGTNFESYSMHDVCNILDIPKTRTTSYHPQCDGLVERQNRTLQNMSAFASKSEGDWGLWLDSVGYAYNTSRYESVCLHTNLFLVSLLMSPCNLS